MNESEKANKALSAYKGMKGRRVYIDFDLFIDSRLPCGEKAILQHRILKRLDPCFNLIGRQRAYKSPAELQKRVDEYFEGCYSEAYNKDGDIVRDSKGIPIRIQTKPFTLAGLALHLGITTNTLSRYYLISRAANIPQEYADIIVAARQKIEAYAEEQLYSKDGQRGAQFVLNSGFKWVTAKEKADIKARKKQIKLQQEEFKLKKQLLGAEKETEGTGNFEIRIVRADKVGGKDEE